MIEFSEIVYCIENFDFNINYLKFIVYLVVICYFEFKILVRERNFFCIFNIYFYILILVKVV